MSEATKERKELSASTVRPFDAAAQMLTDLMAARGFRVARGTYCHGNGETLPTWVIDRPDSPAWNGVWQPWETEPEMPEDGEAQTLLVLCGMAIEKWNEEAWMYCDAPNARDHLSRERSGRDKVHPIVKGCSRGLVPRPAAPFIVGGYFL